MSGTTASPFVRQHAPSTPLTLDGGGVEFHNHPDTVDTDAREFPTSIKAAWP